MMVGFFLSPEFFGLFNFISDIFISGTVDLYPFYYSLDWYEVSQTTAFVYYC